MKYQVEMDYIGGILSENGYKFATKRTKPYVRMWMKELAGRVRELGLKEGKYRIGVYGKFWDERRPDISNLFKVVSDAVQMGSRINDKWFTMVDEGYELGYIDPKLVISIEEA